jgi:hypothetical protein
MDIKFLNPMDHKKVKPSQYYTDWFLHRTERTAFITPTPLGLELPNEIYREQELLVTREWIMPITIEEMDKRKLLYLYSENPCNEPFNVYLALTISGRIKLGVLEKNNKNNQVSK